MSIKINKNGKEYPVGVIPQSLYDDVEDLKGKFVSIQKNISGVSIATAWGSLYEGIVDVATSKDYSGKNIQVTFVPDQGQSVIPIVANVLSTKIQISLLRATTATVSGTINILICND